MTPRDHNASPSIGELMQEIRDLLAQYPQPAMTEAEMAEEWLRDLSKRAQGEEDRFYKLSCVADRLAMRISYAREP